MFLRPLKNGCNRETVRKGFQVCLVVPHGEERMVWVELPSIGWQIGARDTHDPSGSKRDVMSGWFSQ